jgi:hypothetical protein
MQNGLEASSIIRSLDFSGLIIGLTGNTLDDDVARFIQAGNSFIPPSHVLSYPFLPCPVPLNYSVAHPSFILCLTCSCPRPSSHTTLHVMYVLLLSHSCWSSLFLPLRTHPSTINQIEANLHTLNLEITTNRFSSTSFTLSSFSLILSC